MDIELQKHRQADVFARKISYFVLFLIYLNQKSHWPSNLNRWSCSKTQRFIRGWVLFIQLRTCLQELIFEKGDLIMLKGELEYENGIIAIKSNLT